MKKLIFLVCIVLIATSQSTFAAGVSVSESENLVTATDIQELESYSIKEIKQIATENFNKSKKTKLSADCYNPDKKSAKVFIEQVGDDYTELIVYPDWSHISHGVRGGTSYANMGYVKWSNREVWLDAFMDGYFRFKASYTLYIDGYDQIDSIGKPYGTNGVYSSSIQGPYRKNYENSSGPAYAYYKFSCVNMGYQLRLNVGGNAGYTTHYTYNPWM